MIETYVKDKGRYQTVVDRLSLKEEQKIGKTLGI